MQIQNDFSSRAGREYQNSHTHHINKCLFEDEYRKQTEAAGGKGGRASVNTAEKKNVPGSSYEYNSVKRDPEPLARKRGFLREFWDSMGDPAESDHGGSERIDKENADGSRNFAENVIKEGSGAVTALIRQRISGYITDRWEYVRERIRVNVNSALKRFGKRRDAFAALSDPGRRFSGKRGEQRSRGRMAGGVREPGPEVLSAEARENHLLDSYSKKGEYCHLKDHL